MALNRSLWLCGAAALSLASVRSATLTPPRTEVRPVVDRIQNVEFVDPYLWLEQQGRAGRAPVDRGTERVRRGRAQWQR